MADTASPASPDVPPLSPPTPRAYGAGGVVGIFLLSLALSLFLTHRSQVGGDQLNLLARGWLLAAEGRLVPYGNPGSAGGVTPGAATSLVMGLPLLLWRDPRAPGLLLVASQLAAFLLLDALARESLGRRGRMIFAVLYGLSPTRLLFSGLLWNPGFLFLAGAVHAWTAHRQRREGRFLPSLAHALALALAFQLHPSAVILGVASAILIMRGGMRVSWAGLAAGAVLGGLTLLPTLEALRLNAELLPIGGKGFVGRGLVLVFPLVHGVLNWFRNGSLALGSEATSFDFTGVLGAVADGVVSPLLQALAVAIGALSALVAMAAAWWLLRRFRRRGAPLRFGRREPSRSWLDRYALCCFLAAVSVYCLAPTTPMWWQGVAVMHAAVLPLARWGSLLLRTRWGRHVRRGVWAWGLCSLSLVIGIGIGNQHFRCGGRRDVVLDLAGNHPMIDGLRLRKRCSFEVNAPRGWWPDVLPREHRAAAN